MDGSSRERGTRSRSPRARASGVAIVAVALAACGVHARGRGTVHARGAETLQLERYFRELRTVRVEIAGERLPFLLDTGAGVTALTPETARLAGCRVFGRLVAHRMDGARVELSRCSPVALGIGARTVEQEPAVLDLASLLPPGLPPLGGILSLRSFESIPFTLDLAGGTLTLETEPSLAARVASMRRLQARVSRPIGGAALDLFVAVAAAPAPLWMELDTGNIDRVRLSAEAARALGIPDAGGAVDSVPMALVGLAPIPADAHVGELIYDGVVGAKYLGGLVVSVDLARGAVWAAPRPRVARQGAPVSDQELEAMCTERLPACRHPYAELARPHPCAGRGARCMEAPSLGANDWTCACDACGSDEECAAGERCAAAWRGCPPRRVPRACVPGARGPEPECPPEMLLDPPAAAPR